MKNNVLIKMRNKRTQIRMIKNRKMNKKLSRILQKGQMNGDTYDWFDWVKLQDRVNFAISSVGK